jgi:cysteinyl-tRNA synthetase
LNTAKALGILNLLLKDDSLDVHEKAALVLDFDRVLGLRLNEPRIDYKDETAAQKSVDAATVEALLEERAAARKAKNFAESDRIRDALQKMGVVIKDSPTGTTWSLQSS